MFWRSRPGLSAHEQGSFLQADLLWALGSVCALHRIAFSAELIAREFPGEASVSKLTQAAKALGFRIKAIRVEAARLSQLPLPLLVVMKREDEAVDRLALITAANTEVAVVFEGGTNTPKPIALPELQLRLGGMAWIMSPQVQAANDADAKAENAAGVTRHFGFSWFGPELLRHRKIWRDVLLASLALQLVALATPLFTQVIVDKVVVHRTQSTLVAIAAIMAILLAFNAVLSWGRQYLVLHTGNRVDAVLGAAVWDHLLKLPASYFERRPTGVVAARLHAVENIREFVSGAAISLLLDLPFLVICLAVMLSYSALLTACCLGVVLVIALASIVMAPVFQKRMNEQFMLGARNQAFVTEHIAGFETVKTLQMEPQLRQRYSGYLATYLASGFRTKQIGNTYHVDGEATANPEGRVATFDWCDVDHRFGMDSTPLSTWETDSVVEAGNGGNDTVIASASVVLANVETVILSETAPDLDIAATTDAGAQTLIGNSGRNTLAGGEGADFMSGGGGDDTYFVDDAGDVVVESADAGHDIVRTTVDQYVLGENLESLLLEGDANLSASGNAVANVLIGNSGDNVLEGGAGDDFVAGWRGDDVLRGGEGFDYYLFARGDGSDQVIDSDGELHFSGDIRFEELSFSANAYDLVINVAPSDANDGVQVTLADWLWGDVQRVSQMSFCTDGLVSPIEEFVLMHATNDVFTVAEGSGSVSGNLLDNDAAEVLRGRLTSYVPYVWGGQYGTAQADENGSFEYAINADSADFQALAEGQMVTDYLYGYSVFDNASGRLVGTADIEVNVFGVNDGPVTAADFGWAVEDWEVVASGNVLENDTDVDQDELSVTSLAPQHGAFGLLEMSASGEYRYALDNESELVQSLSGDQWFTEIFQYVTVDSHGAEAVGTLEIDVYGDNDTPVGMEDGAVCRVDGPAVLGNVLENDSDIDVGDALAVANPGLFSGMYGALQVAEDGSFTYSVDAVSSAAQALADGQLATDSFTYTVADLYGAQAEATLTVQVVGVNDGPVAHADSAAVSEDGVVTATGNVLANDSDPDAGDTLMVASAGNLAGKYGSLAIDSHGVYSYTLANGSEAVQALSAGQKVADAFAYTVTDAHGASATTQLTVEITGAADAAGVVLTGTARDDKLVGTAYADVINGGKGSDTLIGGKGDDIFFVDVAEAECDDRHGGHHDHDHGHHGHGHSADRRDEDDGHHDHGGHNHHGNDHDCGCEPREDAVVELSNGGVDTIASSVSFVLPQNVENLMLLGTAVRTGTGNSSDNVMVGSGGASTLSGAAGNDVLVGRSAGDTLQGGAGDDRLYGEGGNDKLDGAQGADRLWGGVGHDVLNAGEGDNLLSGGAGDDISTAGSGVDVIVAGAGNDKVTAGGGNDFIDAGAGNDTVDGGSGFDFIAAGKGSDTVTSGAGRDVIAFNRGDGQDILQASSGNSSADVLSLGGGIRYADLTLNRRGADLIIGVGASDQITSKNWYASQDARGVSTLQVVTVGGDFNSNSTNKLLASKVVAFDFLAIAQQYDAARKANASLGIWALQPALNSTFVGASNTSAFGGDLAFDYATTYAASQGYGTDMTVDAVRNEVRDQSGTNWQSMSTAPAAPPGPTLVDPWVALQAGTDLVVSKAPGASNPVTPTGDPMTDSLVLAALIASAEIQQPTWAVK